MGEWYQPPSSARLKACPEFVEEPRPFPLERDMARGTNA